MKEEFHNIYSFQVMNCIEEGAQVYVLDKKQKRIFHLNNEKLTEVLAIIKDAGDKSSRYIFWKENKGGKVNDIHLFS